MAEGRLYNSRRRARGGRNVGGVRSSPWHRGVGGGAVALKRLRRWLSRKHKVKSGEVAGFPDGSPWRDYGLEPLSVRKRSFL